MRSRLLRYGGFFFLNKIHHGSHCGGDFFIVLHTITLSIRSNRLSG